ncbi:MAG: tripartite tricarboxylate transporter TctB family protein [Burkholderiaceae bacterium]|nr:tripartite tricarboxylate transporter TctB family protein [Burkholderiaceae bacterium]
MQTVRLAASALMTLLVLALCAVLWQPSFAMPTLSADVGLGRGALPQFCVLAALVLTVLMFVKDLLAWRATGAITGPFEVADKAQPGRVVAVGGAALALLTAYVAAWGLLGFLPATIAFLLVVSALLLPAGQRSLRAATVLVATAVLFAIGVWALFVYVLEVPLR